MPLYHYLSLSAFMKAAAAAAKAFRFFSHVLVPPFGKCSSRAASFAFMNVVCAMFGILERMPFNISDQSLDAYRLYTVILYFDAIRIHKKMFTNMT